MTETPILLPEAKADVAYAFLWYEEQSMGLGTEFLRCVETALFAIQRAPLGYPTVHQSYRRSLMRIPAKSATHSDFISDSHSDDIGHPRSEATLAGWICIIDSPLWVKSIFGCDPVGAPLAG
jgi:hypothetical protein